MLSIYTRPNAWLLCSYIVLPLIMDDDEIAGGGLAAGGAAARDPIMMLTRLMEQMVTARVERPRPKAIQCRMYKLKDSWPDFATHFVQCVKAAYAFTLPDDQAALDEACVSWLPSKLEPGPTLVAYDALDADIKANWLDLVNALKEAFDDDTERELFLADVAAFRRGQKGLVEYKNELLRRMKLYQPGLSDVPTEFQRQAVGRFIEGMDDAELKRKLRRHCKRLKLNIEEAFNFAVDYEASTLQTKIREGEASVAAPKSFASMNAQQQSGNSVHLLSNNDGLGGQIRGIHDEVKGLSAKHKISEMQINELCAKSALTEDRISIVSKEVGQVSVNMAKLENSIESKLGRIESLILANQSGQANPQGQHGGQYVGQYANRTNQYQRQPNFRGRGLPYAGGQRQFTPQQQQNIQPSLTGGVGYVNNQVRPNQFRPLNPQTTPPVRPSTSAPSTNTPPVASAAAFGAVGGPNAALQPGPVSSAAAAAAVAAGNEIGAVHPCADPQQQQFNVERGSWWSPGMGPMGALGYDESSNGTFSYGMEDFVWQ